MPDTPFFDLEIPTEDLLKDLEIVDVRADQTLEKVRTVEQTSKISINKIIHGAQMAWGLMQGVIRAAGGSITMTTRLVMSAGFGAVQALYPILSAALGAGIATMDPKAIIAALGGLAQLGMAVSALIAYESTEKQISLQLRGATFTMQNLNNMIFAWL